MKRGRCLQARVVPALLLGLWASSEALSLTVSGSIDDYEAQKRSDTGVYIASENFATGSRVGFQSNFNGSGTNQPGGITTLFFFQLPALGPGESIASSVFSVGRQPDSAGTAVPPTFNGDLYALGVTNTLAKTAAEAQNYWYIGNAAQTALPTPIGGPVQRLGDDFLVPADFIPSTGTATLTPDTLDITSYIQALYADPAANGFTPGTSYLVIRINPDPVTVPTSGTQRYTIAFQGTVANGGAGTPENRPMITIAVSACQAVPAVKVLPAPTGATSVIVQNVLPDASQVNVYANGVLVNQPGSGAGNPPNTPDSMIVNTSALQAGQTLVARQVIGIESCADAPTVFVGDCASVPNVTLAPVQDEGSTVVMVTFVDPSASEIRVYDGATLIGFTAGSPPGSTPFSVDVTVPALVKGHTINATQVINGMERVQGGVEICPLDTASRSIVAPLPTITLLSDGFADGDRDNNGVLDNPDGSGSGTTDTPNNDSSNGQGARWFKITTSNHQLNVEHDTAAPALGEDNRYHVYSVAQDAFAVANIPGLTLAQPGDNLKITMRVRFNSFQAQGQRDHFRFGLYNSGTSPVIADLEATTAVDAHQGYTGTVNTGMPPARRIARSAAETSGSLFSIDETLGSSNAPGVTDNNAREVVLKLTRTLNSTIAIELRLEQEVIAKGEDTPAGGGGPYSRFNEVGFGTVYVTGSGGAPYLEFSVDDVVVVSSVYPCASPVFDADLDTYVDGDDLLVFQDCFLGPTVPIANPLSPCMCMDADHDNDVDASDFGAFQRCYSGLLVADPACAP